MSCRITLPAVLLLTLALGLAVSGCGRKGDPAPPLRFIPAATQDLRASQQGREVILSLAYPSATEAGMPLPKLERVEIWELTRDLPPREDGAPAPEVEPPTPQEFEARAERISTFSGDDLSVAVSGDRLVFRQPLPSDAPARPQARFYAVRSATSDRDVSEVSNLAGLVPRYPPPEPPEGFEVEQTAGGIELRWEAAPLDEGEEAVSYRIYRRDPSSRYWGDAIGGVRPGATSYVDTTTQFDTTYIYGVTTVVQRSPLIESAPGGAREVEYRDTFPPEAPGNPVALVEEGRLRLVWEPVAATDLAGYHVYRRTPGRSGDKVHDGALTRTEYVDDDVEAGSTYLYRITAVDERGNEGPPSDEVRAQAR